MGGHEESIWGATKYRVIGNGEPNRILVGKRQGTGMAAVKHSWGAHLGRDGDSGQGCWGALAVLVWHAVLGQRRGTWGWSHLWWHKNDIWGQWRYGKRLLGVQSGWGLGAVEWLEMGYGDGEKGLQATFIWGKLESELRGSGGTSGISLELPAPAWQMLPTCLNCSS